MHPRPRLLAVALVLGAGTVLSLVAAPVLPGATAHAQQGYPQSSPQSQPRPQPKPQTTKRPPQEPALGGSEATLRQRVEQLEEQLVDLQVVIGTVESMARSGGPATAATSFRGGPPVGGGSSGADAGRIAALETQVQALTAQLEQMADQLRTLQAAGPRGPSGPAPRAGGPGPGGFTTQTVPPRGSDPIASIINNEAAPSRAPASSPVGRQQYEAAYSQLLQRNYPAAETGFAEFLERYPTDELAANAQFWLGETHFVRNQWDSAAAAFLKVAQNHPRSDKAPDSLAKLAMAMERRGNKPAACRALQELKSRYPNPPSHVRMWEQAERRRAGCS